MSCDQSYPFPQVFLVDGGGGQQHSAQPPGLIPCWSFPPAQERVRSREKSRGCMGVSPSLATVVLLLFLLVFAALGFQAYQIEKMKDKLKDMKPEKSIAMMKQLQAHNEFSAPEKQIGHKHEMKREEEEDRTAAHVIGRIESETFPKTLRWNWKTGQAFVSGAVAYRPEDGALQVNQTGLYHIYSRVELLFKGCSPTSSFDHTVFVRRVGHTSPLTLMVAHRAGFCSQRLVHSWTTESYLGSALQLQKSDRVFVNVSHPTLLSHTHYANFFGLYKI
ncbi:tumor necrosis factor ligand superfamily member 6 [Epinephelus lanceolatus]|uniref:tumor necrosis factor ligand superfamily member 6 n=1 Tax=Epinephelus lanceolatus TaxID=310571 RepID=UPI001445DD04|nr:tumor necrosis factor ligand superfamily member 6 [Epinephelus lanceolatus]